MFERSYTTEDVQEPHGHGSVAHGDTGVHQSLPPEPNGHVRADGTGADTGAGLVIRRGDGGAQFFDSTLLAEHHNPVLAKLASRRTDEEYVAIGPTLGNRHQWWANFYRAQHTLSLRFDELLNNVTLAIRIRFCDFEDVLYEVRS